MELENSRETEASVIGSAVEEGKYVSRSNKESCRRQSLMTSVILDLPDTGPVSHAASWAEYHRLRNNGMHCV